MPTDHPHPVAEHTYAKPPMGTPARKQQRGRGPSLRSLLWMQPTFSSPGATLAEL